MAKRVATAEKPKKERLVPIDEALTRIPVGLTLMRKLINSGALEAVKVGRRTFLKESSVDRVVADGSSAQA